jgi:hypothetical protein
MHNATAAAVVGLAAFSFSQAALAEDTVERCNELAVKLETKVKDNKLEGAALDKANAFLEKMRGHCSARQFIEAGAARLDVMIEIDQAKG